MVDATPKARQRVSRWDKLLYGLNKTLVFFTCVFVVIVIHVNVVGHGRSC